MHTQDMEHHDNLYADEGSIWVGESRQEARRNAYWAVGTIALMVVALGFGLAAF